MEPPVEAPPPELTTEQILILLVILEVLEAAQKEAEPEVAEPAPVAADVDMTVDGIDVDAGGEPFTADVPTLDALQSTETLGTVGEEVPAAPEAPFDDFVGPVEAVPLVEGPPLPDVLESTAEPVETGELLGALLDLLAQAEGPSVGVPAAVLEPEAEVGAETASLFEGDAALEADAAAVGEIEATQVAPSQLETDAAAGAQVEADVDSPAEVADGVEDRVSDSIEIAAQLPTKPEAASMGEAANGIAEAGTANAVLEEAPVEAEVELEAAAGVQAGLPPPLGEALQRILEEVDVSAEAAFSTNELALSLMAQALAGDENGARVESELGPTQSGAESPDEGEDEGTAASLNEQLLAVLSEALAQAQEPLEAAVDPLLVAAEAPPTALEAALVLLATVEEATSAAPVPGLAPSVLESLTVPSVPTVPPLETPTADLSIPEVALPSQPESPPSQRSPEAPAPLTTDGAPGAPPEPAPPVTPTEEAPAAPPVEVPSIESAPPAHFAPPPRPDVAAAGTGIVDPGPSLPLLLGLIAAGTAVAAGVVASVGLAAVPGWRQAAWRMLKRLGVVGLFTRLTEELVVLHPRRAEILEFVQQNPGERVEVLRKALGLPNGTVLHHLEMLENHGVIRLIRSNGMVRVFSRSAAREAGPYLPMARRRLLERLQQTPGLSQTEISRHLGMSTRVVSYHLSRLRQTGLVRVERAGIRNRCFAVTSLTA